MEDASRAAKLAKLFKAVVQGQRELKSAADGDRFLESLCAQQDASKCVEWLVIGKAGLKAVAHAFRFAQDSAFLNGKAAQVLHYLSLPSLKQLYGGQFLHQVLAQIVHPPSFWDAFVHAYDAGNLTPESDCAFAWLLLELLQSSLQDMPDVRPTAERITQNQSLINSGSLDVRNLGHKIKHFISSTSTDMAGGPGGRHDNDFTDFRKIKILPTSDEFASTERPFYRQADAINSTDPESRGLVHLDNQFRLLREDLLGELRSDYQIATGQKKGKRKTVLENLSFCGVDCGTVNRRKSCSLMFECMNDIPRMQKITGAKERKDFLAKNKSLLKHGSLGCIVSDGNTVAFATVDRNEDMLCKEPAILNLRISDESFISKVLLTSKISTNIQFVQVDTAVFAYEPILKCLQSMTDVPLQEQLLNPGSGSGETLSSIRPTSIIKFIGENIDKNIQTVVETDKPVELDASQTESLLSALSRRVSVIQGPPGTGKSFLGALAAKILHDDSDETILVLTYNNHALDQFLVDLENIGIPSDSIVRLGQKFNDQTQHLSMSNQGNRYKMSRETYNMIQDQKMLTEGFFDVLVRKVQRFREFQVTERTILDYLEFSEDSEFFDAFEVPEDESGMTLVGKKGKRIDSSYLLNQWITGKDAGVFHSSAQKSHSEVWGKTLQERKTMFMRWSKEILEDEVSGVQSAICQFNQRYDRTQQLFRKKDSFILNNKRIIGCTTTGAAKYTEDIQKASPGIVLVEEAGEILESHVLTALTPDTKQIILIGDHKQLRPKINNFELTVEKGSGYNLNQSLFERLVLAGFPHTTLNKQHRMRPEISSLVRSMTYPELQDALKTKLRPSLRGFQNNIVFLSHTHPEVNDDWIAERRDGAANSSKENVYEAEMTLRCVRYLGQQGYGTDQMVVLTPYLGQLYLLQKHLSTENDPFLNDLDSYEFIRAGLLSPAGGNISKRKIRISTIDNYQGEESDIVIACLTRSNAAGDIGFMSAPQRVNVLLSRARNALIMIGNAETFMASRKGKDVWVPLMNQLKREGHVYDGLPVKCEQHPDKVALLTTKEDFDLICPDGGCAEPCGKMLNCGLHTCPQKCHQLQDHSKMACNTVVEFKCPQDHKLFRKCHDKAATICHKCEAQKRAQEKKRQRDFKLDQDRQAKQREYAAKLAEVEDEIEHQKRVLKDRAEESDRQAALAQKRQDLANLKAKTSDRHKEWPPCTQSPPITSEQPQSSSSVTVQEQGKRESSIPTDSQTETQQDTGPDWDKSEAKDDWEWQKKYEGAQNGVLDSLMSMIGLESVKQKFLSIKSKIDTFVRQNVSLKGERFGAALLGNPGTGKTTVARLYAAFLADVGALPGKYFFETSGSALANEGVSACKAHIDKILEEGGGVFFIDETYQLVSGNSPGGKAVLDYLLAEIENLTGKIVFVLAGYHKQMEAFFAHNPGIPSRIPIQMEFQDYNDQELQQIFRHYVNAKYKGTMRVEGSFTGLYARIVARRIGRGRGRDGFGNAREVQNKISQITERQAERLRKQRKARLIPDDYFLTMEDLIGAEPSAVLNNNAAWAKLQKLIGLDSVKASVQTLLNSLTVNYQRELEEKPVIEYSLNRCFIGSPGTGKTSVAKLYGQILKDLGLLSNGEVVVKNPADFVGNVLGGSEANTKAILASTIGKVLVIDEAYMLAGGGGGTKRVPDPFKAAVIDTIVAEVQSTPGEDRCVLLLGYKDQMEEMFRDVNPGLARRFPLASAFEFEDFTDAELRQILDLKLKDIGFDATDQAKRVALEVLQRLRNRPNFGNAGEVDNILNTAKSLHQNNLIVGKTKHADTFEAIDFDPDFDRGERCATNLAALFKDEIGREDVIKLLQEYQTTAANMKKLALDPREQIPFNFLFKGPPGTGKTTTAQKMGKVFYDMGFLSQAKVEECSASEMIGEYVGHTGPKVQKLLEKALGKVLFIDEAYRLAEGHFAVEAMDELVNCLTNPKFQGKLVTILAGYDHDMDRLLTINPGLTSRFPESVFFKSLSPENCLTLLVKTLAKHTHLDITVLSPPSSDFEARILDFFQKLSMLNSWGNARDVKTLAKSMFSKLISSGPLPEGKLILTESIVAEVLASMLTERSRRNEAVGTTRFTQQTSMSSPPPHQQDSSAPPPPKISTGSASAPPPPPPPPTITEKCPNQELTKEIKKPSINDTDDDLSDSDDDPIESIFQAQRDPSVSDETWAQLERDKRAMYDREIAFRRLQQAKREEEQRIQHLLRMEQAAKTDMEKRAREAERVQAEQERRRKEEVLRVERERRDKEKAVQRRLKELGRCPMGYRWIRQGFGGGYRCAGGSHFLSDKEVGGC